MRIDCIVQVMSHNTVNSTRCSPNTHQSSTSFTIRTTWVNNCLVVARSNTEQDTVDSHTEDVCRSIQKINID